VNSAMSLQSKTATADGVVMSIYVTDCEPDSNRKTAPVVGAFYVHRRDKFRLAILCFVGTIVV